MVNKSTFQGLISSSSFPWSTAFLSTRICQIVSVEALHRATPLLCFGAGLCYVFQQGAPGFWLSFVIQQLDILKQARVKVDEGKSLKLQRGPQEDQGLVRILCDHNPLEGLLRPRQVCRPGRLLLRAAVT